MHWYTRAETPTAEGGAINQIRPIRAETGLAPQPRAIGAAALAVRAREGAQTRLTHLHQSGCLKLVLPKTHRPEAEAMLVNTAGGITGGDRLSVAARVEAGGQLTLTTQAAERAYRAQPGQVGMVESMLSVAKGARLNWLPQELILYDRSALHRRLHISLQEGAELLMSEVVVFGRKAMGEVLNALHFEDRIRIDRAGRPLYRDGMQIKGAAQPLLDRPGIGAGAGAVASLVMVSPRAQAILPQVRALLPKTAGASMLAPDTLVMRHLAEDSFLLRQHLVPVLDLLTDNTLPTAWRL